MTGANLARLLLLAAVWGASFLFMRAAVPWLGPAPAMFLRVAIAAAFLALVLIGQPRRTSWREHGLIGVLNSAVPFVLLAFATRTLEAGTVATLNATAPGFAVLVEAIAARRFPSASVLLGTAVGVGGVAVAVGGLEPPVGFSSSSVAMAVVAALAASLCYGLAAVLVRRRASAAPAREIAAGSMVSATAALALPALATSPPPGALSAVPIAVWIGVLALGLGCTGVAYLIYFRLVAEAGPAAALSVTFLVPLFAIAWAALFLGEPVRPTTLVAAVAVVIGTALTTGAVGTLRAALRRHAGKELLA
jgi:drug/metabolite transporter (DMT)-like permease